MVAKIGPTLTQGHRREFDMNSKRLKRALCAFLTAAVTLASCGAYSAAKPTTLTVLCSNDTLGTLEPCG